MSSWRHVWQDSPRNTDRGRTQFTTDYHGLVTIDDDGLIVAKLWQEYYH